MGIMKENSNSGIQRHLFSQTELNKEFALSKTTYKWVLCSLSMQPQMDYDQNICHKSLDRMYLLIIFGSIREAQSHFRFGLNWFRKLKKRRFLL